MSQKILHLSLIKHRNSLNHDIILSINTCLFLFACIWSACVNTILTYLSEIIACTYITKNNCQVINYKHAQFIWSWLVYPQVIIEPLSFHLLTELLSNLRLRQNKWKQGPSKKSDEILRRKRNWKHYRTIPTISLFSTAKQKRRIGGQQNFW